MANAQDLFVIGIKQRKEMGKWNRVFNEIIIYQVPMAQSNHIAVKYFFFFGDVSNTL